MRRTLALGLALLVLLGTVQGALAQTRPGSAELKRVSGRVEVLKKGQPQSIPAVVGAKLVEGDDIRAFSGASAELELPDGSTLVVGESSRIVLSKLDFDQANQSRVVLVHLAVGKVIATLAQSALALVRARQSNFAITTPTAVAAARGTRYEVTHEPGQQVTRIASLSKDPQDPTKKFGSAVTCASWYDRYRTVILVENYASYVYPTGGPHGTAGCGAPIRNDLLPDFATLGTPRLSFVVNPAQLNAPPSPPTLSDTLSLTGSGTPPIFFFTGASPVIEQGPATQTSLQASFGQSTLARDVAVTPASLPVSPMGTGLGVPGL
jgi:hypothetical protein